MCTIHIPMISQWLIQCETLRQEGLQEKLWDVGERGFLPAVDPVKEVPAPWEPWSWWGYQLSFWKCYGDLVVIYPPVKEAKWQIIAIGKSTINGPFSIAILDYRRVNNSFFLTPQQRGRGETAGLKSELDPGFGERVRSLVLLLSSNCLRG